MQAPLNILLPGIQQISCVSIANLYLAISCDWMIPRVTPVNMVECTCIFSEIGRFVLLLDILKRTPPDGCRKK